VGWEVAAAYGWSRLQAKLSVLNKYGPGGPQIVK
jgi:hypothetical protein